MAKLVDLSTGRVHDTNIQTVKENQVVILNNTGVTQWVVYKIDHDPRWGYTYHIVNLDDPHFETASNFAPWSQKFGIGWYYDDENPEYMDAFEVAILRQQAQQKAEEKAEAERKEKERRDQVKAVGRERLKGLIPANAKAAIIACERKDDSDRYTDYYSASTVRSVILGFSTHTKNNFQEMRNYAGNFEETAYLTEKNEEYENRENYTGGYGYYLGESKYHGWIIEKVQIYNREHFIGQYAYTAGDEENIRLKATLEKEEPTETATSATGKYTIVDYSEKSVAIFGETRAIKEQLSALGGRFNRYLTLNGDRCAGWIFQKSKEDKLRRLINPN